MLYQLATVWLQGDRLKASAHRHHHCAATPSVRAMRTGRLLPSQTAWNLKCNPPAVRPIQRPLFFNARASAVRFYVPGVDHDLLERVMNYEVG